MVTGEKMLRLEINPAALLRADVEHFVSGKHPSRYAVKAVASMLSAAPLGVLVKRWERGMAGALELHVAARLDKTLGEILIADLNATVEPWEGVPLGA
jgi:hypothetical protein